MSEITEEDHFDCWMEQLENIAKKHGERAFDRDAWREGFDAGKTAAEAFYAEYPEHKK